MMRAKIFDNDHIEKGHVWTELEWMPSFKDWFHVGDFLPYFDHIRRPYTISMRNDSVGPYLEISFKYDDD